MTQQQNLPLESTDRIAAVVAANAAVQSSKARTVFQTSKIRTRHSSYYLLRSIQAMFFTILLTLCTSSSFAFQAPPPPTTTTTHLLIGVKHEKSALLSSQRFALKSGGGNVEQDWNTANNSTDFDDNKRGTVGATYNATAVSHRRRSLLFRSGLVVASPIMMMLSQPEQSSAVLSFGTTVGGEKESRVVFYSPNKNASDALQSEQSDLSTYALNSEICLLKLLPVKNPTFRGLERSVVGLSSLKTAPLDQKLWEKARNSMTVAINTVDTKRSKLEPLFNENESAMMQVIKGEKGERFIEDFRNQLVGLRNATVSQNLTRTLMFQKKALLSLADVGGFLVKEFPYDVPTEGRYSYLPRLMGRAKVTFEMRRRKKILGNITIIADGFAAPITAGNFVDLSIRNFYTGLPVKLSRKKVGSGSDFEIGTIPVFGSFQEGFYDPLTAKLRRIPLEIIRLESGKGIPKLSYAEGETGDISRARWDFSDTPASISSDRNGKSLLSFDIPGLVALNHPDKNLNSGSSEFFSLQLESLPDSKRQLLDGDYAPFGYIVEGYDLFLSVLPGDIIENTYVDELGIENLVKLRQSSFSEVVQGSGNTFE